ncbi:MAG: SBBP repeat-containing protein [Candidatus Odinarchaeota archaeon]
MPNHFYKTVADPYNFSKLISGERDDWGRSIVVDRKGSIFVVGDTQSAEFVAKNSYSGGTDVYVAEFSPVGELLWGLYIGGTGDDHSAAIAIDSRDDLIIAGYTNSTDFPVVDAQYPFLRGATDAFILKLTGAGEINTSTYIGGNQNDLALDLALDGDDSILITGYTESSDFPISAGLDDALDGTRDAFAAKFLSDGYLLFSTYLGGSGVDKGNAITADQLRNIYITGETDSSDFPATMNAHAESNDAFIVVLTNEGFPVWGNYIGGNDLDTGTDVKIDPYGNVVVMGDTFSGDLAPAYPFKGNSDIFVVKFSSTGNLLSGILIGGENSEQSKSLVVDLEGNVYMLGDTSSDDITGFNINRGRTDVLLVKMDPVGAVLWTVFLGGSGHDSGGDFVLTDQGNILITGYTNSSDFPITETDKPVEGFDIFVSNLYQPRKELYRGAIDSPFEGKSSKRDAADSLFTLLTVDKPSPLGTLLEGSAGYAYLDTEDGNLDTSDYYYFPFQYPSKATITFQSDMEDVVINVFDLEGRVNISKTANESISTYRSKNSLLFSPEGLTSPTAFNITITIPVDVELLIIHIDAAQSLKILYSLKVDQFGNDSSLFIIGFYLLILLILPLAFFLRIRWDFHRALGKKRLEEEEEDTGTTWPLRSVSTLICLVSFTLLILLFEEISREKILNSPMFGQPARGFVNIGYIFLILAGTSLLYLILTVPLRKLFKRKANKPMGLVATIFGITVQLAMLAVMYAAAWVIFWGYAEQYQPQINTDWLLVLIKPFFEQEQGFALDAVQLVALQKLVKIEYLFLPFSVFMFFFLVILGFASGFSLHRISDLKAETKKNRLLTGILLLSLVPTIVRMFLNLWKLTGRLLRDQNFFIRIPDIPAWHEFIKMFSEINSVQIPLAAWYALVFGLQGIFFAWALFKVIPGFLKRALSKPGFSSSVLRLSVFFTVVYTIFIRTLHQLFLIPVGIDSFTFSTVLSDPFSLLLLPAIYSEIIEIFAFLLGLVVVPLIIWLKSVRKEKPAMTQPIEVSNDREESIAYQHE